MQNIDFNVHNTLLDTFCCCNKQHNQKEVMTVFIFTYDSKEESIIVEGGAAARHQETERSHLQPQHKALNSQSLLPVSILCQKKNTSNTSIHSLPSLYCSSLLQIHSYSFKTSMSWFEYEMSLVTSCKLGAWLTRD